MVLKCCDFDSRSVAGQVLTATYRESAFSPRLLAIELVNSHSSLASRTREKVARHLFDQKSLLGFHYPSHNKAMPCLNNLRQLGLATWMYSHDYDDQLPPSSLMTGNTSWVALLLPHLSCKATVTSLGAATITGRLRYLGWRRRLGALGLGQIWGSGLDPLQPSRHWSELHLPRRSCRAPQVE